MQQQSFRVLLVEDDDSLRVCLGEFLSDHGWNVGLAANAAEAIELAMRQRFDFSILDFHLPNGTTGIEVFRRICAVRPLPAILMSGAANRDETAMAMQAGIFTFLRKPLDLERLRQSMHLLIQHHFGWPNPAPQPRPRPPQGPCR